MIADLATYLGLALLTLGVIVMLIGVLGLFRFRDFYARLHAGGVIDTLGAELAIFGLVILFAAQSDWPGVIKLLFIGLFLALTSPTASHAIASAALTSGLLPKDNDGNEIPLPETAQTAQEMVEEARAPGKDTPSTKGEQT